MNRYILLISFFILSLSSSFLYSQDNTNDNPTNALKSRLFFTERDKLTSKINIYTSWKETYKYLRDNRFRFYKRAGRTLTLEFRYKYPSQLHVNSGTPIIFTFDDGSTIQLTNIQKVIYNPYLMGDINYYDVEVRYKFNQDSEFEGFANKSISNIRFNFINQFGEEDYEDIGISILSTSNWQEIFSAFKNGIDALEELQGTNNNNTNY
ncbi:hypothetical protein OFR22_04255 [Brachyspira hyodysenteriae]|uniref:DUF4468 domain-containing protein n=2 Tax=Brachyspira hyodysenteriae TaxID=159 RepID=A0A3B6V9Q1_BRAHW|nr:hypothetical protein [Brachyspira hyodysenteriae]ACN84532.1 hypothetical protein BHWA1_02073 [Brachyspira hyodysenteriae WA1]ANN63391.1 hypothetical protein BHYOB78_05790 [Brachyspira hyodysenteriae ATCC 27164]AUJ50264.1 hypothetical protein BH718_01830 [Brachyspira hyodysenteriae]KLI19030.1 hypothetical protein SU45_01845 [Brachyspira hyodysenteriae]KLI20967.1 hypothetical protein SR30_12415 [Brachyspira hyodysenteriae]